MNYECYKMVMENTISFNRKLRTRLEMGLILHGIILCVHGDLDVKSDDIGRLHTLKDELLENYEPKED